MPSTGSDGLRDRGLEGFLEEAVRRSRVLLGRGVGFVEERL